VRFGWACGLWPMPLLVLFPLFKWAMGTDPGGRVWCKQRLARSPRWFCTMIEVVLHVDQGGFARSPRWICTQTPRWFCTQIEVVLDLHTSRGCTDCTDLRQILGIVPRRAFWVQLWNISSLYSKVSVFRKDSRSNFSFCIHRKVSMFILKSLRISSCSCCWTLLLYMTDRIQKSLCKHLNT